MNKSLVAALAILFAANSSQAAVVWTDWQTSNLAVSTGTAGAVSVTHTGTLQFAQLGGGVMIGSGAGPATNYWTEPDVNDRPYTDNAVINIAPTPLELLAFSRASVNKITFSAPVLNPVMTLLSVGQGGLPVTYDFDSPFTVLSEGRGFWGNGSFTLGAGDTIVGRELHAAIQFSGTFTEINWTNTAEFWHGFTVGTVDSTVPEPGTFVIWTLLGGLVAWRRQRRKTQS